ncbi:MAG: FliM/FliN family flagellar motor switch protein [Puniceicoccales bacterium]|jgi:flagellar motor switch/type III secretory pathway protein FliN|nr:FliM/FliN family flagellar motor switch protein [Puniceicoccales bacterium]
MATDLDLTKEEEEEDLGDTALEEPEEEEEEEPEEDEEEKEDVLEEREEQPDARKFPELEFAPEEKNDAIEAPIGGVAEQPSDETDADPAMDGDSPERTKGANLSAKEPQKAAASPIREENNFIEQKEDRSGGETSDEDAMDIAKEELQQDSPVKEAEEKEGGVEETWPVHERALATAKEVAYAASTPRPRDGFDVGAIEMTLSFDLGTLRLSLRDLESIKEGYSFLLDRPNDEFVTIRANGQPIGRGRIVNIDGRVGVQVEELNER